MGRRAGVTAEETRAQLVDAAAEVFAKRGYEGTRVAEIAQKAGLSTGAIYAHYGNKADLLNASLTSHGPSALDNLLAGDPGISVTDLLRQLGEAVGHGRKGDGALLAEAVSAARRDEDVARIIRKNVSRREIELAELIGRAQEAGEIDAELSPDAIARMCTALVMGALVTRALQLDRPHPDAWSLLVDRFVSAISAEAAPTSPEADPS